MSIEDRAAGAVMGALVGDALGVGPHWYYDLEEMRRDYGEWVDNYTNPMPHRYHAGLKAGQLSQAGIITVMLLRSVVTTGDYDESDFCRRLDEELFPQLDGKPVSGPGGYTSQSIREAWRREPCCTPLTAAGKTRRAVSSPERLSARKLDSPGFHSASWPAGRTRSLRLGPRQV